MSDEQKDQVVKQQVKELEALRRTYEKAQQDLKDQQTKELGLLQDEQTKLQGVLEGELLGVERESQKTQDSLTLLSTQQKGQEEAKNAQAVSAEITKTSAHLQELLNIRASRLEDLRAVTDAIRQDEIRHGEALQASYTRENLRQQEAELHEFQILRDSSRELRQKADDAKRDMMTYTKEFDALRQAQNQRQQDILRNQKTIFRAQMDEANQVLREAEEFNRRRQHDCLQAARQRLGEAQDQLRNGQQYWRRWDDLVREHVGNTQANEARLIQQEDESRVTQKNQLLINTQVESDRHESLRHQDLQAFKKDVSTKENLENTGATNSLRQDPLNTSGLKVSRGSRAHKVTQLEAQADQVLASLKESTQKTGLKHKLNLMQGIETAIQISQLVDQHNSHLTHAHRMKASLVADQKLKRVSEREQSLMERRKATAKLVNFSGTT